MENDSLINFLEPINDTSKHIIKVIGVGGGGCNAVGSLYEQNIDSVTYAVCNTDSKSLSNNPVPVKLLLGSDGLGAGSKPEKGRNEAEKSADDIRKLLSDNTQMAFIVSAMGGGTGTGAGPVVAKIAKEMGLLTIGVVTLPFYFEKKPKIIKSLKGIEEMRKNVDALLIINNEQIAKVYNTSHIAVSEAFGKADRVVADAVLSISELITLNGKIQTDFRDVETTMREGGGAIMAIGRASGENRVANALINALQSPLLYGNDISQAKRVLLNIYTSTEHELFVDEIDILDGFMSELDNVDFIWGLATDETLGEDVKITIVATGIDNSLEVQPVTYEEDTTYDEIIKKLYPRKKRKTIYPSIITEVKKSNSMDSVDDEEEEGLIVGEQLDFTDDNVPEEDDIPTVEESESETTPISFEAEEENDYDEKEISFVEPDTENEEEVEMEVEPEQVEPEKPKETPQKTFLDVIKERIRQKLMETIEGEE